MARAGAQCGTHALKTYVIIQRSLEPPYTAVVEQLRRGPDEWREPAGALVRAARGTRQRRGAREATAAASAQNRGTRHSNKKTKSAPRAGNDSEEWVPGAGGD